MTSRAESPGATLLFNLGNGTFLSALDGKNIFLPPPDYPPPMTAQPILSILLGKGNGILELSASYPSGEPLVALSPGIAPGM